MLVAALALVISNSPAAPVYFGALDIHVGGLERPALDQRRPDGGVLPARRPGDQTRAAGRRAFDLAAPHSAGHRRRRRHGSSRPHLCGVEQRKPGDAAGLGGAGGDRHRLRARRDLAPRLARTSVAEDFSDGAQHPRRSRCGGDHRRVLHERAFLHRARARGADDRSARRAELFRCEAPAAIPRPRRGALGARAEVGSACHPCRRGAGADDPASPVARPAGRSAFAAASAGTCAAALRRLLRRPGLRLRQCGSSVGRGRLIASPQPGDGGDSLGSVLRQAGRNISSRPGGRKTRVGAIARKMLRGCRSTASRSSAGLASP